MSNDKIRLINEMIRHEAEQRENVDAMFDGFCLSAKYQEALASQAPDNPLDTPLPCDIKVGHVTIGKGCKLSTLVLRMNVLYDMAQQTNSKAALASQAQCSDSGACGIGGYCDKCDGNGWIFIGNGEDQQCEKCFDNEPVQEPLLTLILGGIEGDEYGLNDVEWHEKAVDALQYKLVGGSEPVFVPLYAEPQPDRVAELEICCKEWIDKTHFVIKDEFNLFGKHLGKHRADAMRLVIESQQEQIEALKAQVLALDKIKSSAQKLASCKGRYHTEQNMLALIAELGRTK